MNEIILFITADWITVAIIAAAVCCLIFAITLICVSKRNKKKRVRAAQENQTDTPEETATLDNSGPETESIEITVENNETKQESSEPETENSESQRDVEIIAEDDEAVKVTITVPDRPVDDETSIQDDEAESVPELVQPEYVTSLKTPAFWLTNQKNQEQLPAPKSQEL